MEIKYRLEAAVIAIRNAYHRFKVRIGDVWSLWKVRFRAFKLIVLSQVPPVFKGSGRYIAILVQLKATCADTPADRPSTVTRSHLIEVGTLRIVDYDPADLGESDPALKSQRPRG